MSTLVMDTRQAAVMKVLLVEDNPLDARLIAAHLRPPSSGFRWSCVTRLADALDFLETDHPDVILLDLNLDDSSGYETFRSVRQAAPKAAILVLSGSDDEELAIRTVR